jgi:predicted RNase H-like HicB family nuclease
MTSTEIIFEVREDGVDGGFNARALGHDIFKQGDSLEEIRLMVRDAVACHFGDRADRPLVIRLHFVRDEILAA